MTRRIGFLVFPDFQILDLTGPLAVFEVAGHYRLDILSAAGGPVASSAGLAVMTAAPDDPGFDTLVVAGGSGARRLPIDPALVGFVRTAAAASRRVASVCTGAFILGAAGLLDGRRATTHWRRAAELKRRHPDIRVEDDRIFVADGGLWTSAGITAGIDLALALVEADHGAAAARAVARELVVYHRRAGGQSQYSALLDLEPPSDRIRRVLAFIREHLHEPLPVERLAGIACLSPRQFGRAFCAETGQTPARAVERLRVEAARLRVEDGLEPIEAIAGAVGLGDPERLRRAFQRAFGQSPQALRRATGDQKSRSA